MNNFTLTKEQLDIINAEGNIVVIAVPGSGKTTTITYKIKKILSELDEYQGVIAISYTNKASNELKGRVMNISADLHNSFFGTIYSFYLSEIIIPFAKYLYNYYKEFEVVSRNDFDCIEFEKLEEEEKIEYLAKYFKDGLIILEEIPFLANYVFDNSISCRKYIKAKYAYIFVDEYQDCECLQHAIFKKIVGLGIIGVAVGDPDQSIFNYSGSSPKFLLELSELSDFNSFGLTINHRSHPSIINYAYQFLFPQKKYEICDDKRVYKWNITGDEKILANKIDNLIPRLLSKFNINNKNEIAILCRNNSTANLLFNYMKTPTIYFCETPIDKSSKSYEIFFRDLLIYIFGSQKLYPENILDNQAIVINKRKYQNYVNTIINFKIDFFNTEVLPIDEMLNLTKSIFGGDIDLSNIIDTLNNDNYLVTYKPMDLEKVHIMTIHKSKGLEFDAVFILDLHEYILPKIDFKNGGYIDINEDKCVHYVSLTRARKAVIMAVNSIRHNSKGETKKGIESEFVDNLKRPDLITYRK